MLVALFNLNTPEFSMLLSDLPKRLQEPATRILQNHIKNFSQDSNGGGGGGSTTSSNGINYGNKSSNDLTYEFLLKFQIFFVYFYNFFLFFSSLKATSPTYFNEHFVGTQLSHVIKDIQSLNMNNSKFDSRANEMSLLMNERLTSTRLDSLSKDSGIQSNGGDLDTDEQLKLGSNGKLIHVKSIESILDALNTSTNNEQLIQAIDDLSLLIKSSSKDCKWSTNFNAVLLRLFDYLKNNEVSCLFSIKTSPYSLIEILLFLKNSVQISTLVALRDLLQFHNKEFSNCIELTICKLIDHYKDTQNEVSKMVEEVIHTAARCLPAEQSIFVLKPIIEAPEYPKNLIAIRMLQKLLETNINTDLCRRLLNDILSPLLIVSIFEIFLRQGGGWVSHNKA